MSPKATASAPGRWPDIAAAVLLVALALPPLWPAYGSAGFVTAVVVGLFAGGGLAVAGARFRWGTLTVLAGGFALFLLCGAAAAPGTAIARVLPTPETWRLVGNGVVTVWKQVLTRNPPLGSAGAVLLLPYLLAFAGALTSVTIALRARRYQWAVLPPALVLVVSILFGTSRSLVPAVIGVLMALLALTWTAWRGGRLDRNRAVATALLLAVGGLGGTGLQLLAGPGTDRLVLRDYVVPPLNPEDFSSPLAGMRRYVDELAEKDLFRVTGVPDGGARVRLAAMDSYDGLVWNVTDSGGDTGVFRLVGERITADVPADTRTLGVDILDYSDVWLPNVSGSVDVDFTGARATELGAGFYYNTVTDTGIVAAGLRSGDSYRLVSGARPIPARLKDAVLEQVSQPALAQVPDQVGTLARELMGTATTPYEKVETMAAGLSARGRFSHGLATEAPSRPGHGTARLAQMLADHEMIGDAEQYAALFGLMLRSQGIPARVVLGVDVPKGGDVTVTGNDITAWVEVPFEGIGWVPFDPTPPPDQVPQVQNPEPAQKPQPQVLQPPPPPEEPLQAPPQQRTTAQQNDDPPPERDDRPAWAGWLALGAIPLGVLLVPPVVILAIKAARRRRRRSRGDRVARMASGWDEVRDRAVDLGVPLSTDRTRRETALELQEAFPHSGGLMLATATDRAVFGPGEPADPDVARHWQDVGDVVGRMRRAVGPRARLRALVSLRSLRRGRTGEDLRLEAERRAERTGRPRARDEVPEVDEATVLGRAVGRGAVVDDTDATVLREPLVEATIERTPEATIERTPEATIERTPVAPDPERTVERAPAEATVERVPDEATFERSTTEETRQRPPTEPAAQPRPPAAPGEETIPEPDER